MRLGSDARGQRPTPIRRPHLIREHPTGDPVEPWERLTGHLRPPAPRDQERLGGHVLGRLGIGPSQRKGVDPPRMAAEIRVEEPYLVNLHNVICPGQAHFLHGDGKDATVRAATSLIRLAIGRPLDNSNVPPATSGGTLASASRP